MVCMWNCRQALKFWEYAHQSTVSSYHHVAMYGVWVVVMKEWTMCMNWGCLECQQVAVHGVWTGVMGECGKCLNQVSECQPVVMNGLKFVKMWCHECTLMGVQVHSE